MRLRLAAMGGLRLDYVLGSDGNNGFYISLGESF